MIKFQHSVVLSDVDTSPVVTAKVSACYYTHQTYVCSNHDIL